MPETERERLDRAAKLAYETGRREAQVDARLGSHEARLNAVNGSIERNARNTEALRESVDALGDKVDGIKAALETRAALEADRVKQVKEANEKQISVKQFWLGVATICAMLLVAFLAHGGVT